MQNMVNSSGPERSGYNRPLILDGRTGPAYERLTSMLSQPTKSIARIETLDALDNWSAPLGRDLAILIRATGRETVMPFQRHYSFKGNVDDQRKIAVGLSADKIVMRYWTNRPDWVVKPGLDGSVVTLPAYKPITQATPDEVRASIWQGPHAIETTGDKLNKLANPDAFRIDYSPLETHTPTHVIEYTRRLRYSVSRFIQTIQVAQ